MWRIAFAMMSAIMLTATLYASVLADSHLPADTAATGATAGTTAGTTAAAPVTAVPSAGVGLMADQAPNLLLLGLVGIAGCLALLAVTTRWQRHRA